MKRSDVYPNWSCNRCRYLPNKEYDNKKDFIRCFIKECRQMKNLRIPCSCVIYRIGNADKNAYFEI